MPSDVTPMVKWLREEAAKGSLSTEPASLIAGALCFVALALAEQTKEISRLHDVMITKMDQD